MTKSISLIAGGAGFIGANLIPKIVDEGKIVLICDNLSNGRLDMIEDFIDNESVYFRKVNLHNSEEINKAFQFATKLGSIDEIWHLAANSDIPSGVANPAIDLRDTFLTTFEILKAMKSYSVRLLNFASSSAIYGDHGDSLIDEGIGNLLPISNYGAMKLASEAQISAAFEDFLENVNIFRFPNVVGIPSTHGVIKDFIQKLEKSPEVLQVLGDGNQQKAYLHVTDLIGAMIVIRNRNTSGKYEVVNIGQLDEGVKVSWIAEETIQRVSPNAKPLFENKSKGWIGDIPKFRYSTKKLESFGWAPTMTSKQAVLRAINEIAIELGH